MPYRHERLAMKRSVPYPWINKVQNGAPLGTHLLNKQSFPKSAIMDSQDVDGYCKNGRPELELSPKQ